MQEIIINLMNQFGYFGIMLLIAIENIFPPIPSEVILTLGGFMTTYTNMSIIGVILFATLGSLVGAIVLYIIGRCFTPEILDRWLTGKVGRILGFKKGDVDKAVEWFNKKGKITVLFCRCVPIVRSLISIPAGVAKMDLKLFFLYTIVGSLVWNTILVNLGAIAGASWENILQYMDTYSNIVFIVLIILFMAIAFVFYKQRIYKKNKDNKDK